MTTRLRQGMGQPYGLRVTVLASTDFDPTLPTGATFHVTKPSGALVSWSGGLASQSAASCAAVYSLSSAATDLDEVGTWRAWVQWAVPGQTPGPRTEVVSFNVLEADHKT